MGMFDTVVVKVAIPVPEELKDKGIDFSKEDYQTKDLDNSLGLYEISLEGRLMHLDQNRVWVPTDDDFLGGAFEVESEDWKDTQYHGNLLFYSSYCDSPEYNWEYGKDSDQMTWNEILEIEGYDWWVEYLAVFDKGQLRDISLHSSEKTPIRVRLGNNKEWAEKRERENLLLGARASRILKKIPGWRGFIRGCSRLESKVHEKLSRLLMKLS